MSEVREIAVEGKGEMEFILNLFGGDNVFAEPVRTLLDAHHVIRKGFPSKALTNLVGQVPVMQQAGMLEKAVGISLRTFQRRKKEAVAKRLSQEQSGRTWKFAEVLAKAIRVLGTQEDAEDWLNRPAIGLDQQRPIDLLATTAGVEIVEEHLERLEYGVYA
ncbi:MAG TPA: antitoxin Xre/MbcA/ParS toxin-binding domain-containing protein [Allosphingosinicella sp.]|jgi:putative toxin-antitoxin system antitoxin component (TIGR02293 family)